MPFARIEHLVSRPVLKLDKGQNADCLVAISPEQRHAFLHSNIVDSTFPHQPKAGGPPFLSRTGNVLHAFLRANIQKLTFQQTNYCSRLQTIRWFRRSNWKSVGFPIRLKNSEHFHAFLYSNIQQSTFHHSLKRMVPLSLQKGAAYGMLPICKAFVCLPSYKRLFHIPLQSSWRGTRPLSVSSSSILSFIQAYNILLSTSRQQRPGCQ